MESTAVGDVRNLIIVGSGPAGYTAAVYAARAQLNPLVFEGSVTAGGALMNTTDVENYPGFADGIMGPQLMEEMRKQAERFGAELVTDDVTAVDLNGDIKTVTDGSGNAHSAHAVVLAMGSGYRELGLENEKRLSGHGVSWCATGDGFQTTKMIHPPWPGFRERSRSHGLKAGNLACPNRALAHRPHLVEGEAAFELGLQPKLLHGHGRLGQLAGGAREQAWCAEHDGTHEAESDGDGEENRHLLEGVACHVAAVLAGGSCDIVVLTIIIIIGFPSSPCYCSKCSNFNK